jgi:mono/diheme cytochrome c family protein
MTFATGSAARLLKGLSLMTALLFAAVLVMPLGIAQQPQRSPSSAGGDVARGAYIVNNVAMCPTCHTPRTADGQLDRSRWLQGGPVVYWPAQPTPNWPQQEPRIGGTLPATPEQVINLLTSGIWIDGTELRDPMPKFHMNRADAEAVVAYLRSLTPGR